jgi:hypothetical protein
MRTILGSAGVLIVIVAASFAVAAPVGASKGPTLRPSVIPQNVNISRRRGNQAEQTIAINPTNPNNIVVVSNLDSANALFEAYSTDGGVHWKRQMVANGGALGHACCDPSLAFDSFGNLFLAYLYSSIGDKVPVALSTDGGATFSLVGNVDASPVDTDRIPTKSPLQSVDQPSISTGANSVWVTVTAGSTIVATGAPVTGLGQVGAFVPRESVPGINGKGDYGDVAIGPTGAVMVIYQYPTGGESGAKVYTALDANGLAAGGFANPVLLASTNVGGFDYIPAQPNRSVDAEANLAWDRTGGAHDGRLYAIWTQELPNESSDMDIMLQYTDDNGAHWSTAVQVNDDTSVNSQFNPAIALDPTTGKIGVSYYDCRNDLGQGGSGDTDGIPNTDAQIWATYSTDGGVTFAANFQVSQGTSNVKHAGSSTDYGDYTHASFYGGAFRPVWSDNSNSTGNNPDGALHALDLYTAKVTVP